VIVSHLTGGLGNQLFQYAAACALADRHRAAVKADLSWFRDPPAGATRRDFELAATRAGVGQLSTLDDLRRRLALRIAASSIAPRSSIRLQRALSGFSVFVEPHFEYTEDLLRQPDNVVLVGCWQSERYFRGLRPRLVRELVPRRPLGGRAREVAQRVARTSNAVGIHVRRGDYVSSTSTAAYHGVCPPEYYEQAVRMIVDERPDAELFVFSDDPGWCRDHLRLRARVEIASDEDSGDAVADLHLMALCRHQVISNSSFGWWGAWLSGGDDQIVVAPRRWFRVGSLETRDLIPESWRRL